MTTMSEQFQAIAKMLEGLTGTTKVVEMSAAEFTTYAHDQVAKAMGESPEASHVRLKALSAQIAVCKDNFTDADSAKVKVPIFFEDTTALAERTNALQTVASLSSASAGSAISGLVGKLRGELGALEKSMGSVPEAAPVLAQLREGLDALSKMDGDELNEGKGKAKKEDGEEGGEGEGEAEKTAKRAAEVAWPTNMNEPGA